MSPRLFTLKRNDQNFAHAINNINGTTVFVSSSDCLTLQLKLKLKTETVKCCFPPRFFSLVERKTDYNIIRQSVVKANVTLFQRNVAEAVVSVGLKTTVRMMMGAVQ